MARQHSSFLMRCWDLGSDRERIQIEHIQSGTKLLVRSVADAVKWICAYCDEGSNQMDRTPDEASSAISGVSRGGGPD